MLPIDTLRRSVRARVCATCPKRSLGWESAGVGAALPCEGGCPLFASLPAMLKSASLIDPMLSPPRRAMLSVLEHVKERFEPNRADQCRACAPTSVLDRRREVAVMQTVEQLLKL